MESAIPLAPLLLRNILLPLFIFTDKHLFNLTNKFKPFEILRYTLISVFVFFLKIIPTSLNPSSDFSDSNSGSGSNSDSDSGGGIWVPFLRGGGKSNETADSGYSTAGDTCIARALSQLLSIVNEIPVSSRKYDIVRSYAEKLMDENIEEGYESLRKVNATVLSAAFSRALGQLELLAAAGTAAAAEEDGGGGGELVKTGGGGYFGLNRVFKKVGRYGDKAWTRFVKGKPRVAGSAEKLSAELLWLAQKLAACGSVDEAVRQWASASKLASFALSAQLRLQASLVKLSAFLFKQATCMGGEDDDEGNMEELRKIKMKMLMSWLPFICRASNGTDAPVLGFHEKIELESVLGELIGSLKHEEEQEKVLALWLHHFTHCASTDWPNLYLYYTRWCATSRKLLILEGR